MKDIIKSSLIGLIAAMIGCVFAVFVAEVLLSSQPLGEMFIAGLLIYLCIVIVICTRLILKKLADS